MLKDISRKSSADAVAYLKTLTRETPHAAGCAGLGRQCPGRSGRLDGGVV